MVFFFFFFDGKKENDVARQENNEFCWSEKKNNFKNKATTLDMT